MGYLGTELILTIPVCGFCGKELTKKNSTNAEKEKWISERIVELISTGKTATDAKIQAEAEYSVEKNNKEENKSTEANE